jgi:hypothetical protein
MFRHPAAALLIMDAGDAAQAGLIPGHPLLHADRPHSVDTHALQHPIHLFRLPQNPLQHRRPVAEIAHVAPLEACWTASVNCD